MVFTSCILFTSVTSEQNAMSKGHLALKKATISHEYDVHSFFYSISLTSISINVRTRMSHIFPSYTSLLRPGRPSLSTFLTSNWSNILNLPPYLCVKEFAWFACSLVCIFRCAQLWVWRTIAAHCCQIAYYFYYLC